MNITYDKLSENEKKEYLRWFGKYSPPTKSSRIELFYLLHFREILREQRNELLSGMYDDQIDDFLSKLSRVINPFQQALIFKSVWNKLISIGRNIEIEITGYPSIKSLNEVLKTEIALIIHRLANENNPVSAETIKSMYFLYFYADTFSSLPLSEPFTFRMKRGVIRDIVEFPMEQLRRENRTDLGLVNFYQPSSNLSIQARRIIMEKDNFRTAKSFLYRIFSGTNQNDSINTQHSQTDPLIAVLRFLTSTIRTGNDLVHYHSLINRLSTITNQWIIDNRAKYGKNTYFDWVLKDKKILKKSLRFAFQSKSDYATTETQLDKITKQIMTMMNVERIDTNQFKSSKSSFVNPLALLDYLLKYE